MFVCKKMPQIINAIAAQHAVDLNQPEAWLKLEMPGYQPLVIEHVGPHLISVAHYFEQAGDLVPDPEIEFFTAAEAGWIPVECRQAWGPATVCARIQDGMLTHVARAALADVVEFAEMWAENIQDQGWLEHGRKTAGSSAA